METSPCPFEMVEDNFDIFDFENDLTFAQRHLENKKLFQSWYLPSVPKKYIPVESNFKLHN